MLMFRIYCLIFFGIIITCIVGLILDDKIEKILKLDFIRSDKYIKTRKGLNLILKYDLCSLPTMILIVILFIYSVLILSFIFTGVLNVEILANTYNRIVLIVICFSYILTVLTNGIPIVLDKKIIELKNLKDLLLSGVKKVFSIVGNLSLVIFLFTFIFGGIVFGLKEEYTKEITTEIVALSDNVSTNVHGGLFYVGTTPTLDYVYIPKSENNEINLKTLSSAEGEVTIHPNSKGVPKIIEKQKIMIHNQFLFGQTEDIIQKSIDIYIPNDVVYSFDINLE